jgi:general secretion pathway protein L
MTASSRGGLFETATRIRQYVSIGSLVRTARAARPHLEVFLRWWGAELWACLPETWRHRLRHRKRHFLATFDAETRRVDAVERNHDVFRCAFALAPQDAQEAASLAEINHAIRKDRARLEVIVPEAHVVRREMKLPLAAQDNLRDALGLDLDRYTRFQVRDFYFDYSVAGTDQAAETITVNTAIAPRRLVDDIVTALRDAGLSPSAVSAWRVGAKRPDATFVTMNTERSATMVRLITIALVVLLVALDAAAAYVPLWIKLDVLSDLQARMEFVKAEVEDAALTEQTLSQLRDRNLYLVNLKAEMPSTVEIIGEVARALPDSAWLEQLQVREGRLQLAGFTGLSAELIASLQQSPTLSEVRLEWPVMATSAQGADRFDISARIKRRSGDRQ